MIFNPHWFENSGISGCAVLEIPGRDETAPGYVPLTKTRLEGHIVGPCADFTCIQTFRYAKEVNPLTIEALYRFPLPGDAAVLAVDVRFGDVNIQAVLKRRSEAENEYKMAKKEGKAAALLTRESPDVFTLAIAGIVPDEDVVVRTHYVQMGMPEKAGYSFRVPLTTAPRYVRSDERYSRHANGQPLALLRDPGHRFSLSVSCGGNATMKSPTHALSQLPAGTFGLSRNEVIPDRDCILVWEPVLAESGPACQIFSEGTGDVHFLALVTPPAQPSIHFPRDILILVDHSGSMEGAKWDAANWAVERFIRQLDRADRFNLCLFESKSYWFSPQPLRAVSENKEGAIRFLKDTRKGGTELGVALEQALSQARAEGRVSRHIIVITDAEVTDEGRILRLVDNEIHHVHARRTSMLCIDAAPNSFLARQIAERGGGIAKFLTSSPKEEDITSALDAILSLWDTPVAVGLSLAVNRDNLLVDRRRVKKGPDGKCHIDMGDIPAGRSVWVVARAPPGRDPLTFELCTPDSGTSSATVTHGPSVSALFGARLIAELKFLMHAGYPPKKLKQCLSSLGYDTDDPSQKTVSKVYAENVMRDNMDCMRELIVLTSLNYKVLSAETAFVAVRSGPGRPVEEQVIVPNALPNGWSGSFLDPGPMKTSNRRMVNRPSGGGVLDWVGGGPMDMIMQQDHTMRIERRRVPAKSGNLRSVTNASPARGNRDLPQVGRTETGYTLFSGRPVFSDGAAVLFDSTLPVLAEKLPETVLLKRLELSCKGKIPVTLDSVELLIYAGDIVSPRVRIPVRDLFRHTGVRPLNIRRVNGELIRVVLIDPAGEWREDCPVIEVVVR